MTSESARDTGLAGQDTAATAGQARSTGPPSRHVVRRTRIGGIWVAFALFALVLLLLLIFIAENNRTVAVAYFGAHGHVPLGVALLLAAVLGVLLVAVPGTARSSSCGSPPVAAGAWTPRRRHHLRRAGQ